MEKRTAEGTFARSSRARLSAVSFFCSSTCVCMSVCLCMMYVSCSVVLLCHRPIDRNDHNSLTHIFPRPHFNALILSNDIDEARNRQILLSRSAMNENDILPAFFFFRVGIVETMEGREGLKFVPQPFLHSDIWFMWNEKKKIRINARSIRFVHELVVDTVGYFMGARTDECNTNDNNRKEK